VAAGYSSITVALSSTADTFFARAVGVGAITIRATATAGLVPVSACVLALNPSAANALQVGGAPGSGSITATNCGVFSDSSSNTAISLNGSASIRATSIGTVGGISVSNSTISPSPGNTQAAAVADPDASLVAPTPGACTYTNRSFSSYQSTPYTFSSGTVFCGNTTIGGNGSTDVFNPGIYYVTGNFTLNNANVTSASGVTFVVINTSGGNAPSFSWQNNSSTPLTAPTSNANGGIPGILLWQVCPSTDTTNAKVNGDITFTQGSPATASGTIYAPCGGVNVIDGARLTAASGSSFGVVASTIYVTQGSLLSASAAASGNGSRVVTLQQ
jgi:hypothetical protein